MPVAKQGVRIRADVEVANLSDVGCEREINEDYFLYSEPQTDEDFELRGRLIVVTDGMGGRSGGEVASRLAAETIRDVFVQTEETSDTRSLLIASFQAAHQKILDLAREEPALQGMGTTCCVAILKAGLLYYGHIGDSRIYFVRDGKATPLTEDHSVVARLVRNGEITAEEAMHHPQRNIITAALGLDSESVAGEFPVEPLPMQNGDVVLVCTDGLHGVVNDQEMANIATEKAATDACRELVSLALERGGPDNITVQLLKVKRTEA